MLPCVVRRLGESGRERLYEVTLAFAHPVNALNGIKHHLVGQRRVAGNGRCQFHRLVEGFVIPDQMMR